MHVFQKKPLAVALTLTLAGAAAQAEQQESSRGFDLDPIVVTSTLGSETVNESLSSVTVIDPETMDRQQPRELSQVLRGQPGVNVVSNGSFGKNTSVFTRGTGSESTILLLDGIRIRSATSGGAPWQFIPPQLINRMEIVRGPRGSLYGADAVGGVVQGFTLPEHERNTHWIEAGGGSFSTRQAGAGASGKRGNTRYSLQGNHFDTEGTRIREGGDNKGYRNAAGTASVSHEFDNGGSVGVLGLHSRGNTEFDSGETDFVMQTLGVNAETPVTNRWTTSVQLSESRDEQDQVEDDSFFDTKTRSVRWMNSFDLSDHELILGSEYLVDEVDAKGLVGFAPSDVEELEEDSRYNASVFGQIIGDYDGADLQLSLRHDNNEEFGEETTGAIAAGFDLDPSHGVRLSYGTAFRAPTFNDLYFPFSPAFQFRGNPDVQPETSETLELGVRGHYNRYFWDLAAYQTDVDDLIQNQPDGDDVLRPVNVNRARIRGAEFSSGASFGGLDLASKITFLDPRDRDNDNRLPRRPTQTVRVDADYSDGPVTFGVSGVIEGGRYNDADNEEWLSGFATADMRVGVRAAERLWVRFNIDNVFNRQYSTSRNSFSDFDYLAAGRTVFASIRYGAQ